MPDTTPLADVKKDLFDRLWAIMCELGEQQRHFNGLQSHYRTMASTWLLASIAAVGLVYSDKVKIPVPAEIVVMSIGLAGAFGIVLLWMLDLLVYHELLVANYEVAKEYERDYQWLPQVRATYKAMRRGPAVRVRASRFYIGSAQLLTFVAAAAVWRHYDLVHRPIRAAIGAGFLAFIAVAGGITMMWYVRLRTAAKPNRVNTDTPTSAPHRLLGFIVLLQALTIAAAIILLWYVTVYRPVVAAIMGALLACLCVSIGLVALTCIRSSYSARQARTPADVTLPQHDAGAVPNSDEVGAKPAG